MLVALYGTLKVGYFNYELHLKGHLPTTALFLDVPFEMYENDEYPMLVPSSSGEHHRVWLELFDVDDEKLKELDTLEAPYGYWRESVYVEALGENVGIYLHPAPAPEGFTRVDSGEWLPKR